MKIGLVLNWEDHTSELEQTYRIKSILEGKGHDVVVIDPFGRNFNLQEGRNLVNSMVLENIDEIDFTISQHYEIPHFLDCFSYNVNWNPIEYLHYSPGTQQKRSELNQAFIYNNLRTHDWLLSGESKLLDSFSNILARKDISSFNNSYFHVSCQEFDFPDVDLNDFKVFYIGANWDQRHNEIFKALDKLNIVEFYGPQKGWVGIENYKGSLPFDGGYSIVKKSNELGVTLVLSSEEHRNSGVISSRLFQACAAGAVIISDYHPFIDNEFADCVLKFNYHDSLAASIKEITQHINWIRTHKDEALEMAKEARNRFEKKYSLNILLDKLIDEHARCVTLRDQEMLIPANKAVEVDVIIPVIIFDRDELVSRLNQLLIQTYKNINLKIACDKNNSGSVSAIIDENVRDIFPSIEIIEIDLYRNLTNDKRIDRKVSEGEIINLVLEHCKSEYVNILKENIIFKKDHIQTLVQKAVTQNSNIVQSEFYVRNMLWVDWADTSRDYNWLSFQSTFGAKQSYKYTLSNLLKFENDGIHVSNLLLSRKFLNTLPQFKSIMQFLDRFYVHLFVIYNYLETKKEVEFIHKLTGGLQRPDYLFNLNFNEISHIDSLIEKDILIEYFNEFSEFYNLYLNSRYYIEKEVEFSGQYEFSLLEYLRKIFMYRPGIMKFIHWVYRLLAKFLRI